MKRNALPILLFILGLGVFSYPIIANYFSTSAHQAAISNYQKNVEQLNVLEKEAIRKKSKEYNQKIEKEDMYFRDPYNNTAEETGSESYYNMLNIGQSMGRLTIEKIEIDLPIYHGTSAQVLSKGVGHLGNTSLPLGNKGEHSVLTAHRGLPSSKLFREIDKLIIGDVFTVQVVDELMVYEIYAIQKVLPNETDWLTLEEQQSIITLLSCEPYMINTHRLLVMGELVKKEKMPDIGQAKDQPKKNSYYLRYLFLIFFILLIIRIFLNELISKRRKSS